jgi:hypothetical protein
MRNLTNQAALIVLAMVSALTFDSAAARGHCDTLDGPVVADAKTALQKRDVTPVLKWVKAGDEKEIRESFAKTLKVRVLGDDARDIADRHFFETLVRVHRAGEGVAYTGLKAAGTIDPGIAEADKALDTGSADQLAADLGQRVAAGLRERFAKVVAAKRHADETVEAGRAYVAAYVEYVHFVEAVHALASAEPSEHHHIHAADRETARD